MRKQYIYITLDKDFVYVSNVGREWMLTESVGLTNNGSYDIVVGFPLSEDSEFGFDTSRDPKWFAGAVFFKDFLKGEQEDFLNLCKEYFDEDATESKAKSKDEIQVIYTGGGIWMAVAKAENNYYYAISTEDEHPCLSYFDHEDEDQDCEFPCQTMVWSKEYDEMLASERAIYNAMKQALDREMN